VLVQHCMVALEDDRNELVCRCVLSLSSSPWAYVVPCVDVEEEVVVEGVAVVTTVLAERRSPGGDVGMAG